MPTAVADWIARCRGHLGDAWAVRAVRSGLLGSVLIAIGSLTPAFLPRNNDLREYEALYLLQQLPGRALGTAVLLVGVALLLNAWLHLRPVTGEVAAPARHPVPEARVTEVTRRRSPRAEAVLTWWSLPLLVAPPTFSHDAYSYAAVGWMLHNGVDPYTHGPGALPGEFTNAVDPAWLDTPAPYGPLQLQLQHLIVELTGHVPYDAAHAMKVPAVIGVALMAWSLRRLARLLGHDPGLVGWLALLNPLTLMHFVGGAHNDALMTGLMAYGLYWAARGRLVVALVVIAAAAAIKQPAAMAALPAVALAHQRLHPDARSALSLAPRAAWGAVVFCATFAAITWMTGLGYGWVPALSVPGQVIGMSPPTALGVVLEHVLDAVGLHALADGAVGAVRAVFMVGVVIVLAVLAWQILRWGPMTFQAWSFIAVALGSGALHAWYMLWGGVFLPLTRLTATTTRVVIWGTAFLVGYSAVDTAVRNGYIAGGVTALLGLLLVATGHDRALVRAQRRAQAMERHPAAR